MCNSGCDNHNICDKLLSSSIRIRCPSILHNLCDGESVK
jgi:hypothetical protein